MFHTLRSAAAAVAAAITTVLVTAVPAFAMTAPPDPHSGTVVLVPADPITNVGTSAGGPGIALIAAFVVIALLAGLTMGYFSRRLPQRRSGPVATA